MNIIELTGNGDANSANNNQTYFGIQSALLGGNDTFLKVFSLISKALIILQGFYGVRATSSNKTEDASKLYSTSIWLTVAQLLIIFLSVVIAAFILNSMKNGWSSMDDKSTDEEVAEDMFKLIFGIFFVGMIISCCAVCC